MTIKRLIIIWGIAVASLPTQILGFLPNNPLPSTPSVSSSDSCLYAKKKKKKKSPGGNTIAVNRIAYRNYEILDTLEAGISLKGTEVKAIRDGKLNLRDGYVIHRT